MSTKKVDTILNTIMCILGVVFCLWLMWSWFDVICHNSTDCQYSTFNAFRLLDNLCKAIYG